MQHSSADQAGRQMPHIIPCTCAPDLARDFVPQTLCTRRPGEPVLGAAIINCHTTGLKPGRDRLIELGILRCTISRWRGAVLSLDAALTQHQDPEREIGAGILEYAGLSRELLQGTRLDGAGVERFLAGCGCIIAHNAGFHRGFFHAAGLQDGGVPWVCTMRRGGTHRRSLACLLEAEHAALGCNRCLARCRGVAWLLAAGSALAGGVLAQVQAQASARAARRYAQLCSDLSADMAADEAAGVALHACLMQACSRNQHPA